MVETSFHETDDGQKLAFSQVNGDKKIKNLPGVVFLSGLKSDNCLLYTSPSPRDED